MSPPFKLYACTFWVLFIGVYTHFVSTSNVNRTTTENTCAKYGGLLSYQFFLDDKSCQQYRSYDVQIMDGESAWVAENVNYSKFVSLQGCYKALGGVSVETNISTGQNIYVCLSKCKDKTDTTFIGLEANICRCMSDNSLKESTESTCGDIAHYTVMPGLANLKMNNSKFDDKNKPVYRIHEQDSMTWDVPFDNSFGQCVYMEKITNGSNHFSIKYNTKSCYSKEEMEANGLVCLSEQPFPNDTCTSFRVDSKYYCVKSGALNWLEANQECRSLNGNLVSDATDITEEMESNMQINIRYWTGIFRDFMIVAESPRTSDHHVCLSVRNNSNRLVFEPSDCSEIKQVMCNKPFGEKDITDDPESPPRRTNTCSCSTLVPVVIVLLTFVFVLLITAGTFTIIWYRNTRKKNQSMNSCV